VTHLGSAMANTKMCCKHDWSTDWRRNSRWLVGVYNPPETTNPIRLFCPVPFHISTPDFCPKTIRPNLQFILSFKEKAQK